MPNTPAFRSTIACACSKADRLLPTQGGHPSLSPKAAVYELTAKSGTSLRAVRFESRLAVPKGEDSPMLRLAFALAAVALVATPSFAAPCKDAKGRFIKCPPKAAATPKASGKCRNAKGKFAKCGTPGAKPA